MSALTLTSLLFDVTNQGEIASPSKCHYIRSEADRTIAKEAPAFTAKQNDSLGNWHSREKQGKWKYTDLDTGWRNKPKWKVKATIVDMIALLLLVPRDE